LCHRWGAGDEGDEGDEGDKRDGGDEEDEGVNFSPSPRVSQPSDRKLVSFTSRTQFSTTL